MREFRQNISYNQLITFKAIVETGNISKAAQHLEISTPSVSYALKALEKQIGQALFIRTTRAITPTDIGLQLYDRIHYAIDELTGAVNYICELNDKPTGTLNINMTRATYIYCLKAHIIAFQRAYPDIQLELTLSETLDSRITDKIDVGFRYGETVDEDLISRPISHLLPPTKVALFISQNYAKTHGIPHSIAELSNHKLIRFRQPTSRKFAPLRLKKSHDENSEVLTIPMQTAMVINEVESMIDMALQGFGIGAMSDIIVQEYFDSGALTPILQAHWINTSPLYMYYARESKNSTKVRCFIDFILERLSLNKVNA